MIIRKLQSSEKDLFSTFFQRIEDTLPNKKHLRPLSNEDLKGIFSPSSRDLVWGVFINEELVSTACLLHDIEDKLKKLPEVYQTMKGAEFGKCMTLPEYRQKGYIRELYQHVLRYALEENYEFILFITHTENDISNSLAKKLGFTFHSSFLDKFGIHINCYILDLKSEK